MLLPGSSCGSFEEVVAYKRSLRVCFRRLRRRIIPAGGIRYGDSRKFHIKFPDDFTRDGRATTRVTAIVNCSGSQFAINVRITQIERAAIVVRNGPHRDV